MTARVAWGTLGLAAATACRSLSSGVDAQAPQASSTQVSRETTMTATQSTQGLPADLVSVPPLWETLLEATRNRPLSISRLYAHSQGAPLALWAIPTELVRYVRFVNRMLSLG